MPIAESRQSSSVVVCDNCGFVASEAESHLQSNGEQTNLRVLFGLSLAIMFVLAQLGSWGSHALEIRWLQLRDLTGLGSMASYERMATICKELNKISCVEYAYLRQSKLDPKSTTKLAEFQMSRNKFAEAAKSLKGYVSSKQDYAAYFAYARALGESGRIDEAIRYYEVLLKTPSKNTSSEVAEQYVKHLARAKRFDQAQNVIIKARRDSRNSHLMETEMQVLIGLRSGCGRTIASESRPVYLKR